MTKTLLVILGFIVVASVSFYAGDQHGMNENGETMKHDDVTASVLSASLLCDDNTHFVAEFPTMESVKISMDGKKSLTLPRMESASGHRYADEMWDYFFKGENALVMDRVNQTIVQCHPLFDANNAPVNFGD